MVLSIVLGEKIAAQKTFTHFWVKTSTLIQGSGVTICDCILAVRTKTVEQLNLPFFERVEDDASIQGIVGAYPADRIILNNKALSNFR